VVEPWGPAERLASMTAGAMPGYISACRRRNDRLSSVDSGAEILVDEEETQTLFSLMGVKPDWLRAIDTIVAQQNAERCVIFRSREFPTRFLTETRSHVHKWQNSRKEAVNLFFRRLPAGPRPLFRSSILEQYRALVGASTRRSARFEVGA
jgi:hypothetical protein